MSIWRHALLRRVGFWALLQALPSETALRTYLRSVFLALCSAVIGSILLGALLSVGMIVLYQIMMINHVDPWVAGLSITGIAILILLICVMMFIRSIQQIASVQEETAELRRDSFQSPAGRIVDALKSGLNDGFSHT